MNWYKQKNWNTAAPVESWQGVKVTAGRVTNIDLSFGNLTGTLPNQVGDLVKLKTIYLKNNALIAQDPLLAPKLPLLTDLEEIDYSNNALTGSIVPQIGSLMALKRLILYNNRISGSLPPEIGNLTNLEALDLNFNNLSGNLPPTLGGLVNIKNLYLANNGFNGAVPTQIGQLTQLKELNLSSNELKSIPDNLFTNLTGLTWLGLNTNLFSGSVPSSIAGLTGLTTLRISDNYFNGIPSLAGLINLTAANFTAALNVFDFADIQSAPAVLRSNFNSQRTIDVGNIIKGVGEVANFNGPPEAGLGASLTYLWRKAFTNISGATAINYSIPSAQLSDINIYYLNVSSTATPGITLSYSYNLSIKNDQQFTWETAAGIIPGQNQSYSGAWGDMDNDGDDDLFISRWSTHPNALYINNGNGTFTASNADFLNEVNPARWSSWLDFNNDGKLDIAIVGSSGLRGGLGTSVYLNQGGGNFTRQALDGFNEYSGANFADYNNDGKMDYLLIEGSSSKVVNGATGTSIDLSFTTGGIGVPYFIDMDNDNDLDLFCSTTNPSPGVRLWINDGAGNLVANTTNLIVTDALTTTAANRGASWFDIDNDGDVDLVSLNQNTAADSRVYINDGVGNFTSKTTVEVFGEGIASRLSTHGDFDADGDQDFLVVSTIGATVRLQPVIYNNNGNGTFTRVPQTTQTFQTISGFEGASLADYSNDGFLDIFVGNFDGGDALDLRGEFLYKNKGNSNNWLKLKLVGKASTRTPLGAKIKAFTNGNQQLRTMTSFAGSFSPNSTVVHFGLGANTKADSIQVFWPSGIKQTIKNVNAKQFLTINEGIPLDKKASQSVTFAALPTKTFGDANFALSATASSQLPITFTSSNTAVATVSGSTVTIVGVGTSTITASQAGNDLFAAAANVTQTLTVNKANQSITFTTLADKTLGDAPFALTGATSSNLSVSYAPSSDKITINSSQVTLVKAGRVSIVASQAGNDNFNAATNVTQGFCVKPKKPNITSASSTGTIILTSDATAGNQWYLDEKAVSGAINQTLSVAASGVYKVQVQIDDCFSEFSADQLAIITGDIEQETSVISISPNPVESVLQISGIIEEVKSTQLLDMTGRATSSLILEKNHDVYQTRIEHLSPGGYLLRILFFDRVEQVRFIKK